MKKYPIEKNYCKKKNKKEYAGDEKYLRVRDHYHQIGKYKIVAHSICRFSIAGEIPVILHNGSKYEYHFIKNS